VKKDTAGVRTYPACLTVYDWHLLLRMLEFLLSVQNLGRDGEPPHEQVQRIYQGLSAQLGARVVFPDDEAQVKRSVIEQFLHTPGS
jgi:hypothetical protein